MKKILITLLASLAVLSAIGQANDELNNLIQQSFNYFPRLQELNKNAEINEIRVNVTQSNYLPSINGTASYSHVDPVNQATLPVSATETRLIQFQPKDNYNANVALNQMLWDFGKTKAQIEKAKADLMASRQNTEAAKFQLATQVVNIYYSLIYLRKALELQDTVIAFYESNRKMIEGKIKAGDALKVDLYNIENTISLEKNHKLDFQRQYEKQLALLEYTTGKPNTPGANTFDFSISAQQGDSTFGSNPELLAAEQKINAATAEAKYAESNLLPSLNLQAAAGYRNGYLPDITELRFNYLAGVTLTVPIFQGNRIRQNISLTQKAVQLNQFSMENLTASLQKDWSSANADYVAYQQQLINAQTQIDASREAVRLTQVRFRSGVATYIDLTYATNNLQRSILNQLQLQYQLCLVQAELARIQGKQFWR